MRARTYWGSLLPPEARAATSTRRAETPKSRRWWQWRWWWPEVVSSARASRTTGCRRRWPWMRVLAVGLAQSLGACGRNRYAPPPPPEVTVSQPVEQEVTTYNEFTGHTAAIEAVDIRARVAGLPAEHALQAGRERQEGRSALRHRARRSTRHGSIRRKPTSTARRRSTGRPQAQLEITQAIFERTAGSRTDLVQKTQARDLAKAQLAMARANLEPPSSISPTRTSTRRSTAASTATSSTSATSSAAARRRCSPRSCATIRSTSTSPSSERELLQLPRAAAAARRRRSHAEGQHNVRAYPRSSATETGFPHAGKVDYAGNRVDPETGTIEVRAVFAEPGSRDPARALRARARAVHARAGGARARRRGAGRPGRIATSCVVDDKNVVQYRRVEVGPLIEGDLRVDRRTA